MGKEVGTPQKSTPDTITTNHHIMITVGQKHFNSCNITSTRTKNIVNQSRSFFHNCQFLFAYCSYYYSFCGCCTNTVSSFVVTPLFIKTRIPSRIIQQQRRQEIRNFLHIIPKYQYRRTLKPSTVTVFNKMSSLASSVLSSILTKNRNDNNNTTSSDHHHVVVVGSVNYDMTVYTSIIPKMGETVLGHDFYTSCGGKGANQAIASASSSSFTNPNNTNPNSTTATTKISMICRVGTNDVFGTTLLQNLQRKNVHVLHQSISPDDDATNTAPTTGVACITVDTSTGDNCIIVAPGANSMVTPNFVREQLLQLLALQNERPNVLLVQLEIPYETVLEALKIGKEQLNCITILNPAPAPKTNEQFELMNELYKYTDIIIPNQVELSALVANNKNNDIGKNDDNNEVAMAKQLLQTSRINVGVIVTLGERGAMVVTRTKKRSNTTDASMSTTPTDNDVNVDEFHVSYCTELLDLPCKNEPIVDTIGAGDAFCGSLATYLSIGITNLEQACTYACSFASMSVRRKGANYPLYNELPLCLQLPTLLLQQQQQAVQLSSSEATTAAVENVNSTTTSRPTITFITGNKNKLAEVQAILMSDGSGTSSSSSSEKNEFPYDIINQKIDLPELQGSNPIEIAIEKCKIASKYIPRGQSYFIEDTSLCFNALNGMPGPYIKWFLETCGHVKLNQMLDGFTDKTAYALTVIAYSSGIYNDDDEIIVHVFEGRTDGTIVLPRGPTNFGWDPIFEPILIVDGGESANKNKKTYAEMTKEEKNRISHRGRAFAKFRQFLLV